MKQSLERILEGQFDYKKGGLDISMPKIEVSLCPDEVYQGSFTLSSIPGTGISGTLHTHDLRITLSSDSFSGDAQEIEFEFSSRGLVPGDVCQGEIDIVSNRGEYYVPYVFSVVHRMIDSSLGGIKNLFHFTNLAKSNWEEAVRLFYSEDFITLFTGSDKQYKHMYLGYSRYFGNEQNVDNFLVETRKKNELEFIPETLSVSISEPSEFQEDYIRITRNGWGYTFLNVEADSDIIILSKLEITDDDFLGNYLNYTFQINTAALHGGNNYATVSFYNSNTRINVKVTVSNPRITQAELSAHVLYEQLNLEMITFYEAFRTKKITSEKWIHETDRIVTEMSERDDKNYAAKLFKVQLLITEERYNEATWLLSQISNAFDEMESIPGVLEAYYLYLNALNSREEAYIDEITEAVSLIYANSPYDWRIAWMLLYLSEEFVVSPTKRWMFVEEQINKQCSSPMFYIEAVNMLIINPGLLTRLGDFEVKVIKYASDNDLMSDELIDQFVYLAGRHRTYNRNIYNVLCKIYDDKPSVLIADAIVNLLIKGDKKGTEYAEWFLLAIINELRITKLFEYYFESIDISSDIDIPKMVYLYFSYQTNLDYERCAYLYARVLGIKEEMPEIYAAYSDRIRTFAIDEIKAGHVNRDLITIYKFVLANIPIPEDIAESLSVILFMHRISIDDERIVKAVVYQERESIETTYPVRNGEVYIPVYNSNFTIMFEDSFTNRYISAIEYDLEKLIVPGKLATTILPYVHGNVEFDVYACECSSAMVDITPDNVERYRSILDSYFIDEEYKNEIRERLMQYYLDSDMVRDLDNLLAEVNPAPLGQKERAGIMTFLITRGMFDVALEWIMSFGIENAELKDVVRLCSKLIVRGEFAYDETLLKLASGCFFAGKYDEHILKYLSLYYEGMTKNMRKIFKAVCEFISDAGNLPERIIIQSLFTGYFVPEKADIYKRYVQNGADTDIQRAIVAQNSYDYFIREQLVESFVFEEQEKLYARKIPLLKVSKLAYLKYHSEFKTERGELAETMIKEFLEELIHEDMCLNLFAGYLDKAMPIVNMFSDKTIIEYKTEPGKSVWIHYIIETEDGEASEYITEEMREMIYGIYSKTFTLFYGENLLYYITESDRGEEQLTESGNIQKSDISNGISGSRFSEINDIVVAKSLRDYETVNEMIYESRKKDYLISRLFRLQ